MKYTVIFIEEFKDYSEYNTMMQVYLILGAEKPVIVYMYESRGYYNCYSSLDLLLQREFGNNQDIDFAAIETKLVDTEDGQLQMNEFLVNNFINK